MPAKRRKFQRPLGEKRYRKLFVIAVEGIKTEPQYFAIFNNQESVIRVNCLKGNNDSSSPQVLQRMEEHLKKEALKLTDSETAMIPAAMSEMCIVSTLKSCSSAMLGTALTKSG